MEVIITMVSSLDDMTIRSTPEFKLEKLINLHLFLFLYLPQKKLYMSKVRDKYDLRC